MTDPRAFDAAFRQALARFSDEIVTLWVYPFRATPFTALMLDVVLAETSKLLGLQHQREYYTIDCLFVAEADYDEYGCPRRFEAIIEHENDPKGTQDEMRKLLHFNAPLKVLITYSRAGQTHGEGIENHLERFTTMIEASGSKDVACSSQRILIIFGDKPEAETTWRSYLYARDGFREITPEKKIAAVQ
jgi:hypothetical protein